MKDVSKVLKRHDKFSNSAFLEQFRGSTRKRDFHDRRINCKIHSGQNDRRGNPIMKLITVELTGGIDYLMNVTQDTRVFVIKDR